MEDDKILMARIVEGDHQSFEMLVRRYYSTLFAVGLHITRNAAEAEDMVQDLFADLWSNRRKYALVHAPKEYLFISLRNLAIKRSRALHRSQTLSDSHKVGVDDYWEYILQEETYRLLMEAIEQLPPRCRQVIKSSLTGLRQEKIAEEMGITVSTVKALKADGIKKLRKVLGPLVCLLFLTSAVTMLRFKAFDEIEKEILILKPDLLWNPPFAKAAACR